MELLREASCTLPTNTGDFQLHLFKDRIEDHEHLALVMGDVAHVDKVVTRVHSECITGDIFGCQRCDCQDQLQEAMKIIRRKARGILIYLRQEGRGIGLANKIRAYNLQDQGHDTVEANQQLGFEGDLRKYDIAAQILASIQVKSINLLTNNLDKVQQLTQAGIVINERVPLVIESPIRNRKSLFRIKQQKLGHVFTDLEDSPIVETSPDTFPLVAPSLIYRNSPVPPETVELSNQVATELVNNLGVDLRCILLQGSNMRGDGSIFESDFDFIVILNNKSPHTIEAITKVKQKFPRANFLYISAAEFESYPPNKRLQLFVCRKVHGDFDFGTIPNRKDISNTTISYAVQIKNSIRPLLFEFLEIHNKKQEIVSRAHVCLKRFDDCFLRTYTLMHKDGYPLHRSQLRELTDSESINHILGILDNWYSQTISIKDLYTGLVNADRILHLYLRKYG